MILPNPNKQLPHYVYPFDMWVTRLAEGDLTLYINGKKIIPHSSGVDFLIPAGEWSSEASKLVFEVLTNAIRDRRGRCLVHLSERYHDTLLRIMLLL